MKNITILAIITLVAATAVVSAQPKKTAPVVATPVQRCVTTIPAPQNTGEAQTNFLEEIVNRTVGNIVSDVSRGYNTVGRAIAETLGTVTNIKKIVNRTPCPVKIWKVDKGSTEYKQVAANGTYNGDFWIPWATNTEEYKGHYMTISFDGKPLFWLWQEGANVRFRAREGYVRDAPAAPGLARSGGDRTLFIEIVNNVPIFVFSSN
jgi:hypothetical protein